MAIILEIDIPKSETRSIATFLASDGGVDIPELGKVGQRVLDTLTTNRDPNSLWRTVVGRFVEYTPWGGDDYLTPEGEIASFPDVLCDANGEPGGLHGKVREDLQDPEAVYQIGVPL